VLLGAGVWIVEELRFPREALSLAPPSITFLALPVHLHDHSGAFCRPILVLDETAARSGYRSVGLIAQ
jgi:arylformamidase